MIDIFGILFFLMPMAIAVMYLSWPIFLLAYHEQRAVEQRRRPHRLAGAPAGADRFFPAGASGNFGTDQTHRILAGPLSGPDRQVAARRPPKKSWRWPSRRSQGEL
jgi:hypothetical protein